MHVIVNECCFARPDPGFFGFLTPGSGQIIGTATVHDKKRNFYEPPKVLKQRLMNSHR